MLTNKQEKLLRFIHSKLQGSGVSPSYDEMRNKMKIKSKSGIYRLILGLEERGFIRRLPGRARALEIVRLPEVVMAGLTNQDSPNYKSSYFDASKSQDSSADSKGNQFDTVSTIDIPVMGKIAAGVPIEAIQNQSHSISVPEDFISSGDHFALEVRGDSMMDAGILNGDTVLVRKENTALNGDIVVALVENQEATLKRFRKKGSKIALEAANKEYRTRSYDPDSVSVQGKLVGLFRRY